MFEYFGKDKEPFLPLTDAELAQWRIKEGAAV
jgi:hypothetical protein